MLGLISGSAAEAAGLQQGDQLLELDGQQLAGQSPFAVASLLQGQEQEEAAQQGLGLENPAVRLKASGVLLLLLAADDDDGSPLPPYCRRRRRGCCQPAYASMQLQPSAPGSMSSPTLGF